MEGNLVFRNRYRQKKTEKVKYVEKFLSEVFTECDEFAVKYLSKVFLHFKMDFTPVPVINEIKSNSIKIPITLFAGKNDILFPGNKMIKRAKKIFPILKSAKLIEDSKHVQSKRQNELIEKTILENNVLQQHI